MKKKKTRAQKENLLFDYIATWNVKQYESFFKRYQKFSDKGKDEYLQDAIDNGIYINLVPLWEDRPVFYKCIEVLHKFEFLKPDTLHVKKWGKDIKILNDTWVGEMYILKLKQSDRRGFSARSTGAVSMRGLPTRSFKSRSHLEQNSTSCIRFGEYESLNFSIGATIEDIVLFHALYRTSLKGRKDVAALMFTEENDDGAMDGIIDSSYTSRVAEIYNVYMRCLGVGMNFWEDIDFLQPLNNTAVSHHLIDGHHYLCTNYQAYLLERICEIRDDILRENPIMLTSDLKKRIQEEIKKRHYLIGSPEDTANIFKMAKKLMMSKSAVEKFEKSQLEEMTEEYDEDFVEQDEYEEDSEEEVEDKTMKD